MEESSLLNEWEWEIGKQNQSREGRRRDRQDDKGEGDKFGEISEWDDKNGESDKWKEEDQKVLIGFKK